MTSTAEPRRPRLISTSEGSSTAAFAPLDWGLLAAAAAIWGSSFLLIAEGLESLEPGDGDVPAHPLRLAGLGDRAARPTRAHRRRGPPARSPLVGLVWLAVPMTMFPIAEQWISSSVTGMLNGSLPLFSATIASILLHRPPGVAAAARHRRRLPRRRGDQPADTAGRLAHGARTALVLVAMMSYGIAGNMVVPLQQRYGALPTIWRAQLVALVLTAPYGLVGLPESSFEWKPVGAVIVLGALGTGLAFVAAGTLMGRVGATRGSIVAYLIPVVALALGVVLRDEHVELIAIGGSALVLVGAWLTSRPGR